MSLIQRIVLSSLVLISISSSFAMAAASNGCISQIEKPWQDAAFFESQGQSLLAVQKYSLIESFACQSFDRQKAQLGIARNLYRLYEIRTADEMVTSLLRESAPDDFKRSARLLRAWYTTDYRSGLPAGEKQQFDSYLAKKVDLEKQFQKKKPWLAGTLSGLLPGSGQVYNGNYQSAALSFVLNSLFLASALELNRKEMPAASLAAGVLFSITYVGNIMGSVESARQINRAASEPELERLRKQEIPQLEL